MEANSELVEAARTLVNSIPKVTELVKGHKKDPLEAKHKLNQTAVKLAGDFSWNPPHQFKLKHLPIAPPNYKVHILYDNSIITSKLYRTLFTHLHIDKLRVHVIKKATWSPSTFDLINWSAHGSAFDHVTSTQQTAKIIHQLINTNRQNHLYYKTSPNCLCCQEAEETCEHVLTCPAEAVATQ